MKLRTKAGLTAAFLVSAPIATAAAASAHHAVTVCDVKTGKEVEIWFENGSDLTNPTGSDPNYSKGGTVHTNTPCPVPADGKDGTNGAKGDKGEKGATGDKGATGATGAPGAAGQPGAAGSNGKDGAPGTQGPAGPAGSQGLPGAEGAPGSDGKNGEDGATGPQGPKGDQGIQGAAGAAGADGHDGAPGAVGPQGAKGDTPYIEAYTTVIESGQDACNGVGGVDVHVRYKHVGDEGYNEALDSVLIGSICNGQDGTDGAPGESPIVTVGQFDANSPLSATYGCTATGGAYIYVTDSGNEDEDPAVICNGINGTNGLKGANGKDGKTTKVTKYITVDANGVEHTVDPGNLPHTGANGGILWGIAGIGLGLVAIGTGTTLYRRRQS